MATSSTGSSVRLDTIVLRLLYFRLGLIVSVTLGNAYAVVMAY
jgi:hypothetical protein